MRNNLIHQILENIKAAVTDRDCLGLTTCANWPKRHNDRPRYRSPKLLYIPQARTVAAAANEHESQKPTPARQTQTQPYPQKE